MRVDAEHPDTAGTRGHKAFEHFQGGGLARAIGTEHGDQLPSWHLEADVLDRGEAAETLGHPVDGDGGHAVPPPPVVRSRLRTRRLMSVPATPQTSRRAPSAMSSA